MKIQKNSAVIAVVALLLCVAVYLNWSVSRTDGTDTAVSGTAGTDTTPVSDSQRLAGYFDAELTDSGDTVDAGTTLTGDERTVRLSEYFDEARLDRQADRDAALALLQATIGDASASEAARTSAEEQIAEISARTIEESRIESLVLAKGFVDCVAVSDGTSVNVVVMPQSAGLQPSDVAKITDIVLTESAVAVDMIRVVEAQ